MFHRVGCVPVRLYNDPRSARSHHDCARERSLEQTPPESKPSSSALNSTRISCVHSVEIRGSDFTTHPSYTVPNQPSTAVSVFTSSVSISSGPYLAFLADYVFQDLSRSERSTNRWDRKLLDQDLDFSVVKPCTTASRRHVLRSKWLFCVSSQF
jgi:hypothetical protein